MFIYVDGCIFGNQLGYYLLFAPLQMDLYCGLYEGSCEAMGWQQVESIFDILIPGLPGGVIAKCLVCLQYWVPFIVSYLLHLLVMFDFYLEGVVCFKKGKANFFFGKN